MWTQASVFTSLTSVRVLLTQRHTTLNVFRKKRSSVTKNSPWVHHTELKWQQPRSREGDEWDYESVVVKQSNRWHRERVREKYFREEGKRKERKREKKEREGREGGRSSWSVIVTQTLEGRMASHALLTTLTRDDRQRKGEQLQQEMPDMRPAGDREYVCVCVLSWCSGA